MFPFFTAGVPIPVVLTLHELAPLYRAADVKGKVATLLTLPIRPFADRYSEYLNRRMFDSPRQIIVHTENHRQELLSRGVHANKLNCIPLGIPMIDFIDLAEDRFELNDSRYLVLIGFISRRKGYRLAVEALKLLAQDIRIVFAGGSRTSLDAAFEDELHGFIAQHGLEERVVITGYLDMTNLKSIIKKSLFVLAPFHKVSGSFSLSVAFSLGKAVLAANLPQMEELAASSRAVELFNCGDPVDLARKIEWLLENPEYVSKLEKNANRYAAKMSFEKVAEQTVELYKNIINNSMLIS